MTEKIKLYKEIENFITSKCTHKVNPPFVINYHPKDSSTNDLPVLFDKNYYIQCIMAIPEEKEKELNKNEKGSKILVNESQFELALYKDNDSQNIIKCLLILIINNIKIMEPKDSIKLDKNLIDINNDYKLLEKLKKFMFEHIKLNKNLHNSNSTNNENKNETKNVNILEKILLGEVSNNIKFFNDKNNLIDYNDPKIKTYIEKIKNVPSKLEIKLKHSDKVDKNNTKATNKNIFNDVLDDLSPNYKNELIDNYLDEIPEEIVSLMKKYKNVNITNQKYLNFINNTDEEEPKDKNDNQIKMDEDEDEK